MRRIQPVFLQLLFGLLFVVVVVRLSSLHPALAQGTLSSSPIILTLDGPASVVSGDTFRVDVVAQGVPEPGLYGVQLEINYDPALISASTLQLNPNLTFIVLSDVDNTTGKIRLVASQQGRMSGLTGDVTLASFEATAADTFGTVTFTFENEALSDAQAQGFDYISQSYVVSIAEIPTPEPTATPVTPTATPPTLTPDPTDEPTSEPTVEPTAEPTVSPTLTPDPTDEPTSEPTDEPTSEPTDNPAPPTATPPTLTPTPIDEPTSEPTAEPTVSPTLIPGPTDEPTSEPTDTPTLPTPEPTDEPTPEPTDEPTIINISGQVILAGRAGNDWSGAIVTIDDSGQTGATNTTGNFSIANVAAGSFNSITADAPGYLSAICTELTITAPETILDSVNLLSGDIDGDNRVDITDATAVGASFGQTGSDLPADITRDGLLDIFDIVLVSVNFGEEGPQLWNCLGK
jgi:hypothetical protein